MSAFAARNPRFETVVRESFAKQGLMATLGARLSLVEPGQVEIEVPFDEKLSQQQGLFHGGVTTSIVDSSCGYSALTLMAAGPEVLTVEFKINLFAPAAGERLVARGRVVRGGRTITVCQGDAYAVRDGVETHCATMVATMMRVELP
mgnify:CR=1 FL=1